MQCLAALAQDSPTITREVFVVDNASHDGTVEAVEREFRDVAVIANERNLGFAAANNAALLIARGRYMFLLNPDAFMQGSGLETLTAFMDEHPEVAASAPMLLNRDGSLQYSVRNFPSLSNALFECLFLHRAFPSLTAHFGEMVFDPQAYAYAHPVDWVSGAAMFVRRETVEEVGPLDERFFLFGEEIDWFKSMNEAGCAVWFVPEARVMHRDDKRGQNRRLIGQSMYGRIQYWRKHEGPLQATVARALLVFYLASRWMVWAIKAVIRSGEFAAVQREAYAQGLRDVLRDSSLLLDGGT
jgi:GT2 family glycosyltransferase